MKKIFIKSIIPLSFICFLGMASIAFSSTTEKATINPSYNKETKILTTTVASENIQQISIIAVCLEILKTECATSNRTQSYTISASPRSTLEFKNLSPGRYTIQYQIKGSSWGEGIINYPDVELSEDTILNEKTYFKELQPNSGTDSAVDVDPKNGQVPTGAGDTYKLLAPIKGVLEENPANPNEYINKMYKIALGFASALAVLMIMFAGFQYMTTEAITGKTNAKKKITGAILGLVLALTSFLIVKTINPNFVKLDLFISGAKLQIDEDVHGDTRHKERNGKYCSSGGSKTVGLYTPGESWGNDATTRADLQKNGIKINNQNCTNVGANNCTSVYKLPTASVINFKNKCKKIDDRCDITITGGTECWLHSWNTQHRPESSTVDLRTTGIENYVKAKGKEVGKSSLGPIFEVEGVRLLKESSHYHVISW